MSRLQRLVTEVDRLLGGFQIGEAGHRLHEFLWSEYADWYIEVAKIRLKAGDPSPLPVLAYVLDTCLRLLHPFMPFVTEAVWQRLREGIDWAEGEALIAAQWPKAARVWLDEEAERKIGMLQELIVTIRDVRATYGVDPGRWIEVYLRPDVRWGLVLGQPVAGGLVTRDYRWEFDASLLFEEARATIQALARANPLHIIDRDASVSGGDLAIRGLVGASVVVPLAGLYDREAERSRLLRGLQGAEAEVQRLEGKLANDAFRQKAPPVVVAREEERLAAARARLEGLRQRLAELGR